MGAKQKKNVLVIGFPGATAKRVTKRLCHIGLHVFLLVNRSQINLTKSLKRKWGDSVTVIAGEPSHIDFGLTGEHYLELADQMHCVLCLMPSVLPSSISGEAIAHVGREIIEFAQASPKLERCIYLSHLDVHGDFKGRFAENDVDVSQHFDSPSALYRLKNERVFRRFMGCLPVTVVRTGTIVGVGQGVYPLVQLILSSASYFIRNDNERLLLTVQEDLVELLAILVTGQLKIEGKTFHFFRPCSKTPGQFAKYITGLARSQVPAGFDLVAAAKRKEKEHGFSAREFWQQNKYSSNIENTWTLEYLEQYGVGSQNRTDELWESLVERSVDEIVGFR